jgi:hypothetical protein
MSNRRYRPHPATRAQYVAAQLRDYIGSTVVLHLSSGAVLTGKIQDVDTVDEIYFPTVWLSTDSVTSVLLEQVIAWKIMDESGS